MDSHDPTSAFLPGAPVVIFNGAYGSGKTEIAVNIALQLRHAGNTVTIADLDIANPYFRSREAVEVLEGQGIRAVFPRGEFSMSDLPIIMPEMTGAIKQPDGVTVLDVGGDDVGSRVLKFFGAELRVQDYELLQVVNPNRPFTQDVRGILQMRAELEAASGCTVDGFVANTHLTDQTTPETIYEGTVVVAEAAEAAGIPLRFATVMRDLLPTVDVTRINCPVVVLDRIMVPPHIRRKKSPLYEV